MGASHSNDPSVHRPPALARRTSSGYAVQPSKGGFCVPCGAASKSKKKPDAPAARRRSRGSSAGGVFSPSRTHPTVERLISDLRDDGVLADLDKVAVSIAVKNSSPSKEITPTHPDAQTSKALPPAPVKTARHSILRRVSSINCPIALPALRSSSSFHAAIGTAEVAAAVASEETATRRVTARRRLTWNDRKGTLGELEHVQWLDVYDGFGTCANVGPDAGASTPGGGGVRRRKSTGGATDASACSFDSKATRVTSISAALSSAERGGLGSGWGSFDADPFAFETAHDAASGLDPAARTAVRRIASTLARHERDGVDVRGMTNAERCGKMLKRKITSKAAALVEGAAAAAAVEDARTYLRGNDPHMMPENHRKRPVVTAGDAILTWVVSAAAAKKRERVELDARNAELQERVLTLLSEVDAMADAVPSRRIAAGLRDLHRMRLQVFDSRSKARAMEAAVAHLSGVILDARNVAEEVSHALASGRRWERLDESDRGHIWGSAMDTMLGEFFYVLALGGLLKA